MFNFSERELNEPTITDEPEAGEGNSKFYLKPKNTSSSLLHFSNLKNGYSNHKMGHHLLLVVSVATVQR